MIHTVDPTQLLSLNCFVIGDTQNQMFTVKIPNTDNVSIRTSSRTKRLLTSIVAASDLELWKLSFPIDNLTSKQLPTLGPSLRTDRLLFDLFTSVLDVSHIHIAVLAPKTGMCYIGFYNFLIISRKVHRLLVPRSRLLHIETQ